MKIKFTLAGNYMGIDLLKTTVDGKIVYVAWMDKFYQANSAAPLIELIDAWWILRRN